MTKKDTSGDVEHKPSIKRQRAMQTAAQNEMNDTDISVEERRENLLRMRRWLDTLIEQSFVDSGKSA